MTFELSKELILEVKENVELGNNSYLIDLIGDLHPADISLILYELDTNESVYIVKLLDIDLIAETISLIDHDLRKKFLKNFDAKEIAGLIKYIESDDAVDILDELPIQKREEVISYIELNDKVKAAHILDLLRYEEGTAGAIMAKELIKANLNWNIKQCIEEIRIQKEKVEKIFSIYVTDNEDVLVGRLSLKKMILAKDQNLVKNIYEDDVVAVESYKSTDEVVDIMQKYDLESIPVINVQQKLIGRITIDDVVDVIQDRNERDMQAMAGLTDSVEEDDSLLKLTKARLPWLLIGLLGGILGAKIIGLFEKDILLIPAMAFFIPLITATGGNVGVQSSSMIVQGLANKSFVGRNYASRLGKVLLAAFINGLIISVLVFGIVILTGDSLNLGLIVAISLFFVVIMASVSGTLTPLILAKFGINPAIASGPFITTANDLIGIAIYFIIARILY